MRKLIIAILFFWGAMSVPCLAQSSSTYRFEVCVNLSGASSICEVKRTDADGSVTLIPYTASSNGDAQRFYQDWKNGVTVLSTMGSTLSYGSPPS